MAVTSYPWRQGADQATEYRSRLNKQYKLLIPEGKFCQSGKPAVTELHRERVMIETRTAPGSVEFPNP